MISCFLSLQVLGAVCIISVTAPNTALSLPKWTPVQVVTAAPTLSSRIMMCLRVRQNTATAAKTAEEQEEGAYVKNAMARSTNLCCCTRTALRSPLPIRWKCQTRPRIPLCPSAAGWILTPTWLTAQRSQAWAMLPLLWAAYPRVFSCLRWLGIQSTACPPLEATILILWAPTPLLTAWS